MQPGHETPILGRLRRHLAGRQRHTKHRHSVAPTNGVPPYMAAEHEQRLRREQARVQAELRRLGLDQEEGDADGN